MHPFARKTSSKEAPLKYQFPHLAITLVFFGIQIQSRKKWPGASLSPSFIQNGSKENHFLPCHSQENGFIPSSNYPRGPPRSTHYSDMTSAIPKCHTVNQPGIGSLVGNVRQKH
ncbi:hypothetical protein CDAR_531911 [Caerostris darwini]|uniref:Uncharacterized protein n=1 Tax=Caerostris darwini TaxID=1538125 RepID=A0AAV4RGI2_9ARAC|nr:hypothetical protein CDAR_531911 [Caerostris darwini]